MQNLLKTIGPGILFASTAIGVSHLVQSTQAGAYFGFNLVWAILLANLLKYPFFEYGSRYANATGTSIIDGYKKLGKPVIWIFFIITLLSMFLVSAAVGNVTAGFMQNLFQLKSTLLTVVLLFATCIIILITNNFSLLDRLIKTIGIVLLLSTLIAFILVLVKGVQGNTPLFGTQHINKQAYYAFLIPLMGWMPTALDLSTWNSLWTVERIKESRYHPTLKETLFDFKLGYLISALLAICFVTLGAFTMFGTGTTFSASGVKFSQEIIQLYTNTFGNWATLVISISAFSIMFGTCIAVFDGYSRAMTATLKALQIIPPSKNETKQQKTHYRFILLLLAIGAFLIIYAFQQDPLGFKNLVTLATTISFLLAPFVAIFNYILVQEKYVGKAYTPNLLLKFLSWLGILFLLLFSIFFLFKNQLIPYLIT